MSFTVVAAFGSASRFQGWSTAFSRLSTCVFAHVREHEVERQRLLLDGLWSVQTGGHGGEEKVERDLIEDARHRPQIEPDRGHTMAQLVRAAQVDGPPHAALRLIAELIVAARELCARRGVALVRKYEMVEQRCRPAVFAALERGERLLPHGRGAAHRLHVLLAELHRR